MEDRRFVRVGTSRIEIKVVGQSWDIWIFGQWNNKQWEISYCFRSRGSLFASKILEHKTDTATKLE